VVYASSPRPQTESSSLATVEGSFPMARIWDWVTGKTRRIPYSDQRSSEAGLGFWRAIEGSFGGKSVPFTVLGWDSRSMRSNMGPEMSQLLVYFLVSSRWFSS